MKKSMYFTLIELLVVTSSKFVCPNLISSRKA